MILPDDVLSDLARSMTCRAKRGSDPEANAPTKKLLLAHRIGSRGGPAQRSALAVQVMTRIARRSPAVMVKVTGSKAVGGATGAHLRYIGRAGHPEERVVHMENEKGEVIPSQDGVALDRIASQWESQELEDGARRSGNVANALRNNEGRLILGLLDVASGPEDMNAPPFKLHPLKGDPEEHWSVWVNGNWRVTFRFVGIDVELVDYQDYH